MSNKISNGMRELAKKQNSVYRFLRNDAPYDPTRLSTDEDYQYGYADALSTNGVIIIPHLALKTYRMFYIADRIMDKLAYVIADMYGTNGLYQELSFDEKLKNVEELNAQVASSIEGCKEIKLERYERVFWWDTERTPAPVPDDELFGEIYREQAGRLSYYLDQQGITPLEFITNPTMGVITDYLDIDGDNMWETYFAKSKLIKKTKIHCEVLPTIPSGEKGDK